MVRALGDAARVWAGGLALTFMMGSFIWIICHEPESENTKTYGDALKSAYFMGDKIGVDTVCHMVAMAVIAAISVMAYSAKRDERFDGVSHTVHYIYDIVEDLKRPGLSPSTIATVQEKCVPLVISKMAARDRGYIENLLRGGLDKASYESVVAIVKGHLESHPEDYAEIVKVIDAATIPDEINKKYGKTISLPAALAMKEKTKKRG